MGEVELGLRGEEELVVEERHTASHLGSGHVFVLATPMMIALMERASVAAVDHLLPEGQLTVGTHVDVRHLAPTPLGRRVTAQSELVAVDERRLIFHVEAFDEEEKVGEGTHQRMIVDLARFRDRVRAKG